MNNRLVKYTFFSLVLLIRMQTICMAQSCLLEAYSNKLLFNFYTDNIDSNLCKFLNKHVSSIYCEPKSKTDTVQGWSVNDKKAELIFPPVNSIHSLYFSKHPFFKEKFSVGRIQINAQEIFKDRVSVENISLYLYFHKKKDAIKAYDNLVDTLTKMSSLKRFTNYNETKKAEFTGSAIKNKSPFGVQLILTRDNIYENSSYYILFIPHNNL